MSPLDPGKTLCRGRALSWGDGNGPGRRGRTNGRRREDGGAPTTAPTTLWIPGSAHSHPAAPTSTMHAAWAFGWRARTTTRSPAYSRAQEEQASETASLSKELRLLMHRIGRLFGSTCPFRHVSLSFAQSVEHREMNGCQRSADEGTLSTC